mgnify:CR=1 FL=1
MSRKLKQLSPAIEELLIKQIAHELKNFTLYCSFSNYFSLEGIVDLEEQSPHRSKTTAWGSWMSPSAPYIYNPKECVLLAYKKTHIKKIKGEPEWVGEVMDVEQEDGTETGTGDASGGGTTAGSKQWESGVTRGPDNQIGVTKWSDVVGSKITRGKANPLY